MYHKHTVHARKVPVYNNDDLTFFSVYQRAKPSSNNVLQPSPLRGSGCNTLSHSGLANVDTQKRMFYPLIELRDQNSYMVTVHCRR